MHGLHISGGFTLALYRLLLGKKITLSDIEAVDPQLYRSFLWIMYVQRFDHLQSNQIKYNQIK